MEALNSTFDPIEPKILDEFQIEYAVKVIEDHHPLAKLPLDKALPFLRPVTYLISKCRGNKHKVEERSSIKSNLLDVYAINRNSNEDLKESIFSKKDKNLFERENNDPYLFLGFGTVAYF